MNFADGFKALNEDCVRNTVQFCHHIYSVARLYYAICVMLYIIQYRNLVCNVPDVLAR